MVRHDELDFLDDITLEQASAALGVPIYPVDADGFASATPCSASCRRCTCPTGAAAAPTGAEYYKYNPHKEG